MVCSAWTRFLLFSHRCSALLPLAGPSSNEPFECYLYEISQQLLAQEAAQQSTEQELQTLAELSVLLSEANATGIIHCPATNTTGAFTVNGQQLKQNLTDQFLNELQNILNNASAACQLNAQQAEQLIQTLESLTQDTALLGTSAQKTAQRLLTQALKAAQACGLPGQSLPPSVGASGGQTTSNLLSAGGCKALCYQVCFCSFTL